MDMFITQRVNPGTNEQSSNKTHFCIESSRYHFWSFVLLKHISSNEKIPPSAHSVRFCFDGRHYYRMVLIFSDKRIFHQSVWMHNKGSDDWVLQIQSINELICIDQRVEKCCLRSIMGVSPHVDAFKVTAKVKNPIYYRSMLGQTLNCINNQLFYLLFSALWSSFQMQTYTAAVMW